MNWIVCILIITSMVLVSIDIHQDRERRELEYLKQIDDAKQQLEAHVKKNL